MNNNFLSSELTLEKLLEDKPYEPNIVASILKPVAGAGVAIGLPYAGIALWPDLDAPYPDSVLATVGTVALDYVRSILSVIAWPGALAGGVAAVTTTIQCIKYHGNSPPVVEADEDHREVYIEGRKYMNNPFLDIKKKKVHPIDDIDTLLSSEGKLSLRNKIVLLNGVFLHEYTPKQSGKDGVKKFDTINFTAGGQEFFGFYESSFNLKKDRDLELLSANPNTPIFVVGVYKGKDPKSGVPRMMLHDVGPAYTI